MTQASHIVSPVAPFLAYREPRVSGAFCLVRYNCALPFTACSLMPTEILLVSIARALAEVAGMFMLGQGVLWIFGPRARDGNFVYDLFKKGTSPIIPMMGICPISLQRKEVSVNTTRFGHLDATRTDKLSDALPELMDQVWDAACFLQSSLPGFENAVFSGIAPRIGIRETRRVLGEEILTGDDIMQARKRPDGIAKGSHELDIHLSGTGHIRSTIKDGGSYDIPFGCLIPRSLKNVLMAGRCFSATREAHSSARVMGTCMAMGQAAGTAAALCVADTGWGGDVREVAVPRLREILQAEGAVLDGTL